MKLRRRHSLVLSIYLSTYGYASVLFEAPLAPVDWGVHGPGGGDRHAWCLRRIGRAFAQYAPDVVVLQDTSERGTRRTTRIQRLNIAIGELAEMHGIPVCTYSRIEVRACFSQCDVVTKDAIAERIAKHVPALAQYTPPRRKAWMSEDRRMALFDAASLAFTFFHAEGAGDVSLP